MILCEDKQKWQILTRIIKKKGRTQQEKIINESRNIIIDNTEIQRTIKEQLKDSKLDLKKKDKFLETYSLPRLNHEERDNLNRPIIS